MTPDDPRHGEYAGYHQHLRDDEKACDPCEEARLRYHRRRHKMKTLGMPRRLPIGEQIHARLVDATHHGMRQQDIANAVGVSPSCVWRYLQSPEHLVAARTWVKLAAFRRKPVLTTIGVIRRVQALHHLGWGCAAIARESGCCSETLTELLAGREVTTSRLREDIAVFYEKNWNTPCPDELRIVGRARGRASRGNWAPAMAWDDDTIDDPKARPVGVAVNRNRSRTEIDEVVVQRVVSGDRTLHLTTAERAEAAKRLRAQGWSDRRISIEYGWKTERYLPAQGAKQVAA